MHILYLHQYFATPTGQTGTRSYEFARRWAADGHRVTMLTSAAALTDADLGSSKRSLVTRVDIDSIEVVALNVGYRHSMGFARRLWAFFWFMLLATWFVIRTPGVDIVYATSTPLTIGVPALLARWARHRPYVFEVRDVWPAVPIEMEIIRNRAVIALLRCLERLIYRFAEAVITLSPGMAEMVGSAAPGGKRVEMIPNCADTDLFHPHVDATPTRRMCGWDGRFVCLHAGAMGRVNGLDCVVRAADHFRKDPDFLFVLLGEGSEKEALTAQRDRLGLQNLQIVKGIPKHDMPPVLAAADLGLLTVTDVPVLEHNSANKLFDYLSAGKPVVLSYGGWQREVLESAGAGLGCAMGDEAAFFANLAALYADEARRTEMGRNARRLALECYNRDLLAAQALKVIIEAAQDYPMLRRSDRI
ncbi:MAG: glycosyltransferase family 4 protein [Phycisphaerales bacterium]|nr:MAG: glycosyltransferase family 4 protein [Phycisphaerales bacterium]